jgi:hypothetical protein
MTEPEITSKDARDIEMLAGGENGEPTFHTVLQVWRDVLEPEITPQWAVKLVQTYAEVQFADMQFIHDLYYTKIIELRDMLLVEIATDDECLKYTSAEEDAVENWEHYRNLLHAWNLRFLEWELDWDSNDPLAGCQLAATAEVHALFFREQHGITAYLDNIKFEFTQSDKDALTAMLDEKKAEVQ